MKIDAFRILSALCFSILFTACAAKENEAKGVKTFREFQALEESRVVPPTEACDESCLNRRQEFRYVVYVGKEIYCYWDLKKADTRLDFDAFAATLEKSIVTGMSPSEYYIVLRKWASAFHDGHVNVMTKADVSALQIYTAPIRVEVMAPATDHEKLIVSTTGSGVDAQVGDEILTVNGVSARDAVTKAVEESSGSTERMRRFWAGRRIVDVMGAANGVQPLVLTTRTGAGVTKTVSLYRNVQINAQIPKSSGDSDGTGAEQMSAKILPNGVGYFRLDGFGGDQDDFLISSTMENLSQTRGLILDLRQNGGGDLSGDRIIERLIDKPVTRYKRSERLSDYLYHEDPTTFGLTPDATGMFAVWHDLLVKPLDVSKRYTKPVVVLTSPWCFSACDTVSAGLRGNSLATFVGEGTGGGTGTPIVFDLPFSPLQFRYSVIRGETPTGTLIEGNGTLPDVTVEPTLADRHDQRDNQLTKAIEILEGKIGTTSGTTAVDATTSLSAIGTQNLDVSPTVEEELRLKRISKFDEKL